LIELENLMDYNEPRFYLTLSDRKKEQTSKTNFITRLELIHKREKFDGVGKSNGL